MQLAKAWRALSHLEQDSAGTRWPEKVQNLWAQGMPNKLILVVCHENITPSFYTGTRRSFLISNCLFREGGAAVLYSNRHFLLILLQSCFGVQTHQICTLHFRALHQNACNAIQPQQ